MPEEFPDLRDGDELRPEHLNAVYRELRKWQRLKGAGGVEVSGADGPGPPLIFFAGDGGCLIGKNVGSSVAAGTPASPTSFTATLYNFIGTGLTIGTATVPALNYHDKVIAANSLVFLAWAAGKWWVIDVASCTVLS